MNKTRHPFSTSASPIAAARSLFCRRASRTTEIGAFFEPAIAGGDRHHLRLAHHGNGGEVEACERLADGQSGLGQMTLDAATTAIGDLVLGERGKEAGGRQPSLSDCSASFAHIDLMAGRRKSET